MLGITIFSIECVQLLINHIHDKHRLSLNPIYFPLTSHSSSRIRKPGVSQENSANGGPNLGKEPNSIKETWQSALQAKWYFLGGGNGLYGPWVLVTIVETMSNFYCMLLFHFVYVWWRRVSLWSWFISFKPPLRWSFTFKKWCLYHLLF